jgi:hypothetical protein
MISNRAKLLAFVLSGILVPLPLLPTTAAAVEDELKFHNHLKDSPDPDEIKFNCANPQKQTLGQFLSRLDPDERHTVRVTGACTENLSVVGYNRLTLLAGAGASITDASGGTNFVIIVQNTFTFDFEGFIVNGGLGILCGEYSTCLLAGNTFQDSAGNGVELTRSTVIMQNDTIQNNAGRGISMIAGAQATIIGETIHDNGLAGAFVGFGSTLTVIGSTIQRSGGFGVRVLEHGSARILDSTIQGNAIDGLRVESAGQASVENGGVGTTITGNGGAGVRITDLSMVVFVGPDTITGNLGGTDVVCQPQFSATRGLFTDVVGATIANCVEP